MEYSEDLRGLFELNANVQSVWIDKNDPETWYTDKAYAPEGTSLIEATRKKVTGKENKTPAPSESSLISGESESLEPGDKDNLDDIDPETIVIDEEIIEDAAPEQDDLMGSAASDFTVDETLLGDGKAENTNKKK